MSDEKKRPPTEKKLRDARQEGESIKSVDATSAGVLAAAVGTLWLSSGFLMDRCARLFALVWQHPPEPDDSLGPVLVAMGWELLLMTVPFSLATLAGAVVALLLQGAATLSAKPVMLRLEAVNPVAGIKRVFGMKAAIEALTMLLKSTVLLALLYFNLRGLLPLLVGATARSPELLGVLMWQVLMRLMFIAVGFFVVCRRLAPGKPPDAQPRWHPPAATRRGCGAPENGRPVHRPVARRPSVQPNPAGSFPDTAPPAAGLPVPAGHRPLTSRHRGRALRGRGWPPGQTRAPTCTASSGSRMRCIGRGVPHPSGR